MYDFNDTGINWLTQSLVHSKYSVNGGISFSFTGDLNSLEALLQFPFQYQKVGKHVGRRSSEKQPPLPETGVEAWLLHSPFLEGPFPFSVVHRYGSTEISIPRYEGTENFKG